MGAKEDRERLADHVPGNVVLVEDVAGIQPHAGLPALAGLPVIADKRIPDCVGGQDDAAEIIAFEPGATVLERCAHIASLKWPLREAVAGDAIHRALEHARAVLP